MSGEEKTPALEEEEKSADSPATSEDYEMVKENSPFSEEGERLVVDNQEVLEESLKECLEEHKANLTITDLSTVINNENLLEDPDHTIFHNVAYLGSVSVHNPKDEEAIQEHMSVMNQSGSPSTPLWVTVSVPRSCNDSVVLRETTTRTRVAQYRIHRIIFFARGQAETSEKSCFAFTCAQGDGPLLGGPNGLVQCHIFRCQMPEAVNKIFVSFAKAFKKPEGMNIPRSPQTQHEEEHIVFEVGLEIREDDGKGNFVYVPRDKDCFKLRSNIEKCVVITLCQVSDNLTSLKVERCFGMLVSPGRNVRHSDMQLLEDVKMSHNSSSAQWAIQGQWDPREAAFAVLNQETGPDINSVYMTVAADLVLNQIAEPVRFVVETKVRIYPSQERFWYYTRKLVVRRWRLVVRRLEDGSGMQLVEVVAGEEVSQPAQGRMSLLTSQLATLTSSWRGAEPELASPVEEPDEDSGDEPILSGSGGVSKECSETELAGWAELLQNWPAGRSRPKQLVSLVRAGVPEALRGEVWQRLSLASEKMDSTVENYRILVTKESPDEKVIFRDIHRTFPAHEFFKESGGVGQEALYRISKAYSVYDSEIGYCQGQSFLIAALLLQMPEEQAFGVLVEIMFAYGLRDLFRENFEQLQLRFYQLERLIEKNMPDLFQHFQNVGLETHMFASQWFLTLFSAKFPLFLVFRVLDVFMLQGVETIFQVSLALLMLVKKELLTQDFEGIMKYFRVNIPKKLRSEDHAKQLMKTVCGIKIKKLAKYEKDWRLKKEEERLAEDPLTRYERENKKLISDNMRLERENDVLAQQLLTRQITMRAEIDKLEDLNTNLENNLNLMRKDLEEKSEEKTMLSGEAEQLKLVLKREVDRLETELKTKENIITDYKKITAQLSSQVAKLEGGGGGDNKSDSESSSSSALARVKELELELAQTKLALVETECKNQDLTHQFLSQEGRVNVSGPQSNTWFTKTLSSIKEVAGAKTVRSDVRKSSSEQVLGINSNTKPPPS